MSPQPGKILYRFYRTQIQRRSRQLLYVFRRYGIPKANTFKPVSKIVCRPFTTSVSFGVPPVRLNLLPCKMILHMILRPYGMKFFRGSDFQGRQMSCTGRTAIADNAEKRFIWNISCVLKVFALRNHHYTESRGNRSLSEIRSEFPLFLLAHMSIYVLPATLSRNVPDKRLRIS